MKHVYLSPHLDDAVLSCGGAIHHQVAGGDEVLVITLFAGDPPPDRSLSDFAQGQPAHRMGAPRPVALRRVEDAAALVLLGAGFVHLSFLDAIYRRGHREAGEAAGAWLYDGLDSLMGAVHPADPVTPAALADSVTDCLAGDGMETLYAPLAVGGHVDHRLVNQAARLLSKRGCRLVYYEDYPYAEDSDRVGEALDAAGLALWAGKPIPLSTSDIAAKVAALAYYRSQLAVLFGEPEAMPSRVWSFAATRFQMGKLAERIWR